MGTKRSNFSLVSMGGKLVAAGGFDGRRVTDVVEVCRALSYWSIYFCNLFQVYHPERDQWQEVSKLPTPKSALAAVAVPRGELTREAQDRFRYPFQY